MLSEAEALQTHYMITNMIHHVQNRTQSEHRDSRLHAISSPLSRKGCCRYVLYLLRSRWTPSVNVMRCTKVTVADRPTTTSCRHNYFGKGFYILLESASMLAMAMAMLVLLDCIPIFLRAKETRTSRTLDTPP
jgi:hypothetical protein